MDVTRGSRGARSEQIPSGPSIFVALLRIFVGVYFLRVGLPKLLDLPGFSQEMGAFLENFATTPYKWYGDLLRTVAIPNAHAFAWMVAVGEVAVGALLVLGLLTGLASLIGGGMTLNYFFATSHLGPSNEGVTLYATIVFIVLIGTQAGRTWGLDVLLARAAPRMKLLW